MRILEVRDGFVKFEADKTVYLSSFIQIDGIDKSYIAQVIQLKRSGGNSIGYAKILFLYDGTLQSYDKTLPSKDSEIKEFTFDILSNSINAQNPIIIGKTQGNDLNITIDESAFNKKMLISVDDKKANNILVRNLTKQFNNLSKNVVIIDTLGVIEAKKIVAGVDFKLPLDTESLTFMYEDCLNDATADSKALIIEIFKDLSEYSKTVPFLPFEALKTIVDDMVNKNHVFKLLVLKNKLAKFDRLGYFAKNKREVDSLKNHLSSKCTIIDISKLDTVFQNRYLNFIYETLDNEAQVFLELSNTISKKNIKSVLTGEKSTTFFTHSRFKYLNDIKNVFDNFIVAPSISNNEIFNIYGTFLKTMPKDTFLIAGEATNYIPLISSIKIIDDLVDVKCIQSEQVDENSEDELEEIVSVDLTNSQNDIHNELEDIVLEEEGEVNNTIEADGSQISHEEILANIEEKSNDVIAKATENIVAPASEINMFSEDVQDQDSLFEKNIEEEPEVIDDVDNNKEQFDGKVEFSDSNLDFVESDIIDVHQDDTQEEISEEIAEEDLETTDNIEEAEEILPDEYITEIHLNEEDEEESLSEIKDYEPIEENENSEIISLNEELDEDSITLEDNEEIELGDDIDLDLEESPEAAEVFPQEENIQEEYSTVQENVESEDFDVMPIDNSLDDELEEIVELNPDDIDDNDIVVDLEDEKELDDNVDEQIVKDVDKVFTTRKDDDISDSDLDFIDELNSDDDGAILEEVTDDSELEELSQDDGILEEVNGGEDDLQSEDTGESQEILQTRNSSTPIVPVYDADIPQEDVVVSDPIQQGDTVTHAKYGVGVVEKMIKYGNKTLFSINFDNVGRRLLDPTLTEIRKA